MRAALIIVNYNNINLSIECIESFNKAIDDLFVVVVDNSTVPEQFISDNILEQLIGVGKSKVVRPAANIGYFPGLALGLEAVDKDDFDYFLIGNNDVVCSADWQQILDSRKQELLNHPVISPRIKTLDGVEQNPMIKDAYSFPYLLRLMVYNSNYHLSHLVLKYLQKWRIYKRRHVPTVHLEEGKIAIGFGAFYILTKRFFEIGCTLPTSSFLMGEEQFLYKELKEKQASFYFLPDLDLTHKEHSSVVKLPKKEIWKYNSLAFWKYIWYIPKKLI